MSFFSLRSIRFVFLSGAFFSAGCKNRSFNNSSGSAKSVVTTDVKREYEDIDLFFTFALEGDASQSLRDIAGLLTPEELASIVKNATTNLEFRRDDGAFFTQDAKSFFPVSTDPLSVCAHNAKNWRISGVRLAPFELAIPGPKETAVKWGKDNGVDIDRAIQLRLAVRAFCPDGGKFASRDVSMHLVFELLPDDALQRKEFFAASLFAKLSLEGKVDEAQAALKRHAAYLTSDDFNTFRKAIIEDWKKVAMARFQDNLEPAERKVFRDKVDTLRTKMGGKSVISLPTQFKDPYLAIRGPSFTRKALLEFIGKHAKRTSLRGVTTMFGQNFGSDGSPWIFKSNVVQTDGTLTNNPSGTAFSLVREGANLSLISMAKVDAAGNAFLPAGASAQATAAFKEQVVRVDNGAFLTGSGDNAVLDVLGRDKEYTEQFVRKVVNPNFNQPTSTDCGTCHLAVETSHLSSDGISLSPPIGGYNFHMMTGGNMNVRTVTEAHHEANQLNAETGGYTISAGTEVRGDLAKGGVSAPPPAATCNVIDPTDTFALFREGSVSSAIKGSFNVGTTLSVSGKANAMIRFETQAFLHKSVITCRQLGGIVCGEVVVQALPGDLPAKSADGTVHFEGSNLRTKASSASTVLGMAKPGSRYAVVDKSGDWFKVNVVGAINATRCK